MANIARVNLTRDGDLVNPTGYTAEFLNFKAGDLAACMASNAQRVSPIGERGFEAGSLVDVELLRGEELIGEEAPQRTSRRQAQSAVPPLDAQRARIGKVRLQVDSDGARTSCAPP
ncbi:MAG: hypothetical protein V8S24_06425 [Gordonibacter pamelaeae]